VILSDLGDKNGGGIMLDKDVLKTLDSMNMLIESVVYLTDSMSPDVMSSHDVSIGLYLVRLQILELRERAAAMSQIICPVRDQVPAPDRLVDTMN